MSFTKIDKRIARKLFNEGKTFWITARNMRPECGLRFRPEWMKQFRNFDALVANFEYYNCDYERGSRAAYYTED